MSSTTWIGARGASWTAGSSWSSGQPPASSDTAFIGGEASIQGIEIDGPLIENGQTAANYSEWKLDVSGRSVLGVSTFVVSYGPYASTVAVASGGALVNYGTVRSSQAGPIVLDGATRYTATLSVQGSFTNYGLLVSAVGGFNTSGGDVDNEGVIRLAPGHLYDAPSSSGSFTNNGAIDVVTGPTNASTLANIEFGRYVRGNGTVSTSGASVTVDAGAAAGQTFLLGAGGSLGLATGSLGSFAATVLGLNSGNSIGFGTTQVDGFSMSGNNVVLTYQGAYAGTVALGGGYSQASLRIGHGITSAGTVSYLQGTQAQAPTPLSIVGGGTPVGYQDNSVAPFPSLAIFEPNSSATVTAAVRLSSTANASLSSATGSYDPSSGTYTVSGTADTVSAALQTLRLLAAGTHPSLTVTVTDSVGSSASWTSRAIYAAGVVLPAAPSSPGAAPVTYVPPYVPPTSITTSGSGTGAGSQVAPITVASVDTYRFFDTRFGTHFFTGSSSERDTLEATRPDMTYEGIGMKAVNPAASDPAASPVYRFFDTQFGTHFFTASASERDTVQATRPDMTYEGTGFYEHVTQQAGDVPVFRFFDTQHGTHFYTADAGEKGSIIATRTDLTFEGVGFYARIPDFCRPSPPLP